MRTATAEKKKEQEEACRDCVFCSSYIIDSNTGEAVVRCIPNEYMGGPATFRMAPQKLVRCVRFSGGIAEALRDGENG